VLTLNYAKSLILYFFNVYHLTPCNKKDKALHIRNWHRFKPTWLK